MGQGWEWVESPPGVKERRVGRCEAFRDQISLLAQTAGLGHTSKTTDSEDVAIDINHTSAVVYLSRPVDNEVGATARAPSQRAAARGHSRASVIIGRSPDTRMNHVMFTAVSYRNCRL